MTMLCDISKDRFERNCIIPCLKKLEYEFEASGIENRYQFFLQQLMYDIEIKILVEKEAVYSDEWTYFSPMSFFLEYVARIYESNDDKDNKLECLYGKDYTDFINLPDVKTYTDLAGEPVSYFGEISIQVDYDPPASNEPVFVKHELMQKLIRNNEVGQYAATLSDLLPLLLEKSRNDDLLLDELLH